MSAMGDSVPGFSESAEPADSVGTAIGGSTSDPAAGLDLAIAELCAPLSEEDPCGPDLDLDGDSNYLNFFAQAEIILPGSFFSAEDGRPFDRTSIDIEGMLATVKRLVTRTRDLRLLVLQARLHILDRNLAGFATSVAAAAHLLDRYWEAVHPRVQDGDFAMRSATIAALDMSTVTFPLQYVPLCEARRIGSITYRGLMIAMDEVQPRAGESKLEVGLIMEAVGNADPAGLAPVRSNLAMLKASLLTIRTAFMANGQSADLKGLPELVGKILAFIDPSRTEDQEADPASAASETAADGPPTTVAGSAPNSLAEARAALAAIADYYSSREPSSPTLPLVRQAHQLIGKSFFDVINILVPSQMEQAAFRIGNDQVFDLPVGKLSDLSDVAPIGSADLPGDGADVGVQTANYVVQTRSQAIALLDLVQRFFRKSEPSSPVPMLCERARALAERDFMSVLRDVLPRSALRNQNDER